MRLILILLAVLLAGCEKNPWSGYGPLPEAGIDPNMSIATLRDLCGEDPRTVLRSAVLEGYVTTSDQANNFYRSFIIDDGTGAVEIRAGMYDLHNTYRLGQRIVVVAGGLAADVNNGLLRLGIAGTAQSQVDYMNHRAVADRYLYRTNDFIAPEPYVMRISDLSDRWVGRLVRIGGLSLTPAADTTWAVPAVFSGTGTPQNGSLKFKTQDNDSVYVYTSGYASFASGTVPLRRLSLTGILLMGKVDGKTVYQLKMRDENDVQMD